MISSATRLFLIFFIRSYQCMISQFLSSSCRFSPTCSNYAIGALKKYGAWAGIRLIIIRISKCHPFYSKTGYDPVP